MKKNVFIVVILVILGFLLGGLVFYMLGGVSAPFLSTPLVSPRVPSQIIETSKAFSEIANSVSPVVVNISTTRVIRRDSQSFPEDPFFKFFEPFNESGSPKKWKEQGLASGVIVSNDGYIITNNHVIEDAEDIKVILYDKKSFKGRIIGTDAKTDIAIIKINANNLPTVQWGDSERLQVGEFVLAIGNPFGLSHTVTMGIISAIGRVSVGIADYEDFIQTDAAINPGNSGGPLVNIRGEVIGINTAIFSKTGGYQGIGFAVPSNLVRSVMEQLIKQGKVSRGWLGVSIQRLTPELAQKFGLPDANGALIGDVLKGGPAENAGIKKGDVIVEFNGKKIADADTLKNAVAQSKAGTSVKIKIIRGGKERFLNATVAEYPKETNEPYRRPSSAKEELQREAFAGMQVVEVTKNIAQQLGLDREVKGVVIVRVEAGSPADEARLKKGDVIEEIDNTKIGSMADFNKLASKIKTGDTVLLYINRGGQRFYAIIYTS